MPSHESLSIEYNLAATAWALNEAISNHFHAEFFVSHMKRLKQPAVLVHDKPIDVETYGQVDKAEIEEIIKEQNYQHRNPTIKTSDNNRQINIHEEDQAREYGEVPY